MLLTADMQVDVGFGPKGPTKPLPLEDGTTAVAIAPAMMRLVKENIPGNADPSQRLWIFQTQMDRTSRWQPAYCFYDVEFLPQDFEIMNFMTSQNPRSPFIRGFLCSSFILNSEQDDIIGTVMIAGNVLKRRINEHDETLAILEREDDRVSALTRWFEISLQPMEKRGIRGLVTELAS